MMPLSWWLFGTVSVFMSKHEGINFPQTLATEMSGCSDIDGNRAPCNHRAKLPQRRYGLLRNIVISQSEEPLEHKPHACIATSLDHSER